MNQKRIVYRGVEYEEARYAVEMQRYKRAERRHFPGGASAKAVFGTGVYLVSNPKVAAEYAICHAETTWDKAAVLQQELVVSGLYELNREYGENELRQAALFARHSESELLQLQKEMSHQEWLEWTGEEVRSFLLDAGYSGIAYIISPELTYYICYEPDSCISAISFFALLDLQELG